MEDITILQKEDKLLINEIRNLLFDLSHINLDKNQIEKKSKDLFNRSARWEQYLKI